MFSCGPSPPTSSRCSSVSSSGRNGGILGLHAISRFCPAPGSDGLGVPKTVVLAHQNRSDGLDAPKTVVLAHQNRCSFRAGTGRVGRAGVPGDALARDSGRPLLCEGKRMHKFRRIAAVGAVMLSTVIGAAVVAPTAQASGLSLRRSCAAPKLGYAACFAVRVTGSNQLSPAAAPAGYHPADLGSAYKLDRDEGRRADGRDRRRVRRPERRVRPRRLPLAVRASRRAPRRTAASRRSTRAAAPAVSRCRTRAGPRRSRSTSTWSRRSARSARSCSSRRRRTAFTQPRGGGEHGRAGSARPRSPTATAAPSRRARRRWPRATGTRASRSPSAPATAAYAAGPQVPAAFNTVDRRRRHPPRARDNARGWSETAWFTNTNEGAGSGCSALHRQARRGSTTPAARGAPSPTSPRSPTRRPGVTVYDSFGTDTGFEVFGGTSASAPIIAGVFALAGNGATINNAALVYSHTDGALRRDAGKNGTLRRRRTCAPPRWATTARPGSGRRTGSRRF